MKLNLILMLMAAGLGAVAQNGPKISAKVPFPFESNGRTMPGGVYEVIRSDRGTSMTIRNRQTGKAMVVKATAERKNRVGGTWMEFKRYGDVYFLSAVSYGANGVAAEIPVAKREKEMALTMTPETVIARAE